MTKSDGECLTCYGAGEVVNESGARACPDCFGEGRALSPAAKVEWRVRDIERKPHNPDRETQGDVIWLIHELRRSREALIRIVARCEDVGDPRATVRDIEFEANEALSLYPPGDNKGVE